MIPQELIYTRPYAREWHFPHSNDRSLYGLPRKATSSSTRPAHTVAGRHQRHPASSSRAIAVTLARPSSGSALRSAALTGHRDFARDTGVIVKPKEPPDRKFAYAVVRRFFIEHGDRTTRTKARRNRARCLGFREFLTAFE